jgi:ATP-dependent Clp protease protease subunit
VNMSYRWPGMVPEPPQREAGGGELEESLRTRLFEQRIVLLSGPLDDARAGRVVAELMTLDATGDGPIHLQLDSPGGSLDSAFAVMDTIDLCGVDVHVTCSGRAEGPAVGVLAVGHRRAATAHARIRLSDPEVTLDGRASELSAQASAAVTRVDSWHERLAKATRRSVVEISADCRTGRYLGAEEALAYRLIDEIAGREASIRALNGRRIGFRPS